MACVWELMLHHTDDAFNQSEIGVDSGPDTGSSNLDDNVLAIRKDGSMNLRDRGRCNRVFLEIEKSLLNTFPQRLLELRF